MKQNNFLSSVYSLFKEKPNRRAWVILARYTIFLVLLFFLTFFSIFFWFSQPGKELRLIDFRGMSIVDSIKWLQERELNVSIYEKVDKDISRFHVISQRPEPGMSVKRKRIVTLVVSKGQNASKMPNFFGDNFLEARANLYVLFSEHIKVPEIVKVEEFSSNVKEGRVISHTPAPGEMINFDEDIVFVVSKGFLAEDFFVEDYHLKDYRKIFEELSRLGIEVRAKFLPAEQKKNVGKIFKQSVKPGEPLSKGDTIAFVVGTKRDKLSDTLAKKPIERLRVLTFYVPFFENQNDDSLDSSFTDEKTSKKKKKENEKQQPTRKVQVYVDDLLGRRLSFEMLSQEGKTVDLPYSFLGEGKVEVFVDGQLVFTESL